MAARRLTAENLPAVLTEIYKGQNIKRVSKKSGVDRGSISRWARGYCSPNTFLLLCVLEPMGYCLMCDGQKITAGNVFDWIATRFPPGCRCCIDRGIIADWRDGTDPPVTLLIEALGGVDLEVVEIGAEPEK